MVTDWSVGGMVCGRWSLTGLWEGWSVRDGLWEMVTDWSVGDGHWSVGDGH